MLFAAPMVLVVLFLAKMVTKTAGAFPATKAVGSPRLEARYTTLLGRGPEMGG